jgi:hypothetical protein
MMRLLEMRDSEYAMVRRILVIMAVENFEMDTYIVCPDESCDVVSGKIHFVQN